MDERAEFEIAQTQLKTIGNAISVLISLEYHDDMGSAEAEDAALREIAVAGEQLDQSMKVLLWGLLDKQDDEYLYLSKNTAPVIQSALERYLTNCGISPSAAMQLWARLKESMDGSEIGNVATTVSSINPDNLSWYANYRSIVGLASTICFVLGVYTAFSMYEGIAMTVATALLSPILIPYICFDIWSADQTFTHYLQISTAVVVALWIFGVLLFRLKTGSWNAKSYNRQLKNS